MVIAEIEERLKKIENRLLLLEKLSAGPQGALPCDEGARGGARAGRTRKAFLEIKSRWPNFIDHSRSWEAFERHCKTLQGEPSREKVQKLVSAFEPGEHYQRPHLEKMMKCSPEEAQAMLYFAKISGFAMYDGNRGLILNKN